MSFSLFQLVPAVYRMRDAQIASTMQLLTAAEQGEVATLQATAPPLSAEQQALLDSLLAKSVRGPLESLLMVIDEQLAVFAEDLDQLYDDQFIETCAPWVIPYIGDLIGFQSIQGIPASVDDSRSEVANTISMRRRKGTVLVLEQLARDITGWGAHAVEFFRVLRTTEYMKHVRLWNYSTPDVRSWQPRHYRNSGFSRMTHNVDVHNPASPGLPRYNTPNIGIFLWSTGAYSITAATPTACATNSPGNPMGYRFSSLGMDMPLFHAAISQGEEVLQAATPVNVPDWLGRAVLCADMQKGGASSYYGMGASLAISLNGQLLNPYQIQVANLSGMDGSWNNLPASSSPYLAVVDPELGRIALPWNVTTNAAPGGPIQFAGYVSHGTFTAGETVTQSTTGATATVTNPDGGSAPYTVDECGPMSIGAITGSADAFETWTGSAGAVFTPTPLQVSYYYGFNAEMGGGEYERGETFAVAHEAAIYPYPDTAQTPRYTTLQAALTYVATQPPVQGQLALEISNSDIYTITTGALIIDLPAGILFEFRAQDECRPTILLDGEFSITGDQESQFMINGLLIAAGPNMSVPASSTLIHVPVNRPSGSANQLSELNLAHCTLVPGWSVNPSGFPNNPTNPTLVIEPPGVQIFAKLSILGAVQAMDLATVSFSDSIVDATDAGNVAYAALDGASGGGALTLTGCTVVGKIHAQTLTLVSDSIIWAKASNGWLSGLIADRQQVGCVRFSFLPVNAITPRRFECVVQALAGAQPIFFTLRYGNPHYLKMLACTDDSVRRGADDGGEMGAFHFVLAPLRESDLEIRLQEYMPVGLDAGLIYQT
jgi:hypothetical protein